MRRTVSGGGIEGPVRPLESIQRVRYLDSQTSKDDLWVLVPKRGSNASQHAHCESWVPSGAGLHPTGLDLFVNFLEDQQ